MTSPNTVPRRPNISLDRISHAHSREIENMLRSPVFLFFSCLFVFFLFFVFPFSFFSNATTADWVNREATV